MYRDKRFCKVYVLLLQLSFNQLHVYVHAVRFKLFYCCTPVMQINYELNTHLDTRVRMCTVYEWLASNALLITRDDCFNSA